MCARAWKPSYFTSKSRPGGLDSECLPFDWIDAIAGLGLSGLDLEAVLRSGGGRGSPGRYGPANPWPAWSRRANAPGAEGEPLRFSVTQRYHPLCGQTFELAAQNREYGEDRVFYRDPDGHMRYLPARRTSLAAPDAFVIAAAGRDYFRLEELIRLAEQIRELQA